MVAWNVCRFATAFCKKCPECAIVIGDGRQPKPSLKPIPVQRPFKIMGLDIWTCHIYPLPHLVCALLQGIEKLNTTASHPQCDSMFERFNRILKSMLHKRAAQFGSQWDKQSSGVLWVYWNMLHDTAGKKPLFQLFGWDC